VPPRQAKAPPTGPKALRDQVEAPSTRNSTLIRHRYDPNFAPTSSQLDTSAPGPVNGTTVTVQPPKPSRLTSSLSTGAPSTHSRPTIAPTRQTSNPRARSYPISSQRTSAAPSHYGQQLLKDDISVGGGYNASNYYACQPPLSPFGTNGLANLPTLQGQWSNHCAPAGLETYRNNSRRHPQRACSSEYWHQQGSRASQGRQKMHAGNGFMTSSTLSHHETGNSRPIPTTPRAERSSPYPCNPPTTLEPTTVCLPVEYSPHIGSEMNEEKPPQPSVSYGFQTSTPPQPISMHSRSPNYQSPVPPATRPSILRTELSPVQTPDKRSDVAEENATPGHAHSDLADSGGTLPTPVTPSVFQLPHPPNGPAFPTIGEILSPSKEPHKRNVFSRMQEVVYDSPNLASVLSDAQSDGRPVVVRNFPLCTWWANTSLNPRNLQKILERPSQPCTGAGSIL
jgi:hypothetical protein